MDEGMEEGEMKKKIHHSGKEINGFTIVDKIRRSVVAIIGGLGWSGESLQN